MKKILIIGVTVLSVIILTVFLVVPVFAQGPANTSNPIQACLNGLNGDYQAMIDACRKFLGTAGTNGMPCFNQGGNNDNPSQSY